MAILVVARRSWWDDATREEQEEYLRTHPRSKLKITKRRKKVKKSKTDDVEQEEKPSAEGEKPAEEAPKSEDAPPADAEKEKDHNDPGDEPTGDANGDQVTELQQTEAGEPVKLSPDEESAVSDQLKELAPELEPEKVLGGLSDEDQQEIEDDLKDAIDEPDDGERAKKFLKAGLRFAIRAGLVTAAVTLVAATGGPTALLLPQVYGSIWSKSGDWSERSSDLLGSAVGMLHTAFKNGTKGHLTGAVRAKRRKSQ